MQSQRHTFEHLIFPIGRERFFAEFLGQKPLYIKGDTSKLSDLFSWQDFDEIINEGAYWTGTNLTLVANGQALKADDYCANSDTDSVFGPHRLDREKLLGCLRQKPSLVLDFCQSQTEPLASLSATLESVFRCYVELHIIASWESKKGFVSHFDHNDVFIFQTEGRKVWNIYKNRYEEPLTGTDHESAKLSDRVDDLKGDILMQPELSPGDVLYLPKGQYHDALASSDATLHLSYRLEHCNGRDFLKMIFAHLAQVPLLRQPLPSLDDTEAHDTHLGAITDELATLIKSPEAREFFSNYQKLSSTQDGFPSFNFPSEELIQFYRVRHETAVVPDDVPENILAWIKSRDFFSADELENILLSGEMRSQVLSALEGAGLIESRL